MASNRAAVITPPPYRYMLGSYQDWPTPTNAAVDHDLGLEGVQRVQHLALVPHVHDRDSTRGSMPGRPRRDRLAAAHWSPLPPRGPGDQDVDAGDLVSEAQQVVAQVGSDKAGRAGHKNRIGHLALQGVS